MAEEAATNGGKRTWRLTREGRAKLSAALTDRNGERRTLDSVTGLDRRTVSRIRNGEGATKSSLVLLFDELGMELTAADCEPAAGRPAAPGPHPAPQPAPPPTPSQAATPAPPLAPRSPDLHPYRLALAYMAGITTMAVIVAVRMLWAPAAPPSAQAAARSDPAPLMAQTFVPATRARVNPTDGAPMVLIPAGPFIMGHPKYDLNPARIVTLDGYWIYKDPVTVRQFRAFCAASGGRYHMPSPPVWGWRDDHPIVNVKWEEAKAYAAWAGADLPTTAEFEKAARGTDGRKYPWGDTWDARKCRSGFIGPHSTAPVGSYPPNMYGLCDMAGNVFELCDDWWNQAETMRVMRGGSWKYKIDGEFMCYWHENHDPERRSDDVGFRCVVRPRE